MTNQQLYILIALPIITAAAQYLGLTRGIDALSRRMDRMEDELKGEFRELRARVDRVADDLHAINVNLGRHDARLDSLEGKNK